MPAVINPKTLVWDGRSRTAAAFFAGDKVLDWKYADNHSYDILVINRRTGISVKLAVGERLTRYPDARISLG